eukprot:3889093-Pyramimonas_sp.AAC.2
MSQRTPQRTLFSLPFCDWCLLRVYSLFPSAIGACYGYILSSSSAPLIPTHVPNPAPNQFLLVQEWARRALSAARSGARHGHMPSINSPC